MIRTPGRRDGALGAALTGVALLISALSCDRIYPPLPDDAPMTPPPLGERRPPLDSVAVFYVGHSLINEEMPKMLRGVAESLGLDFHYASQLGNGTPLSRHWEKPETTRGARARRALSSGRYDALVLAEAVYLHDQIRYEDSIRYASLFVSHARRHRPDLRVFLQESWNDRSYLPNGLSCGTQQTFRATIHHERPRWAWYAQRVGEEAAVDTPHLIPAAPALSRLIGAIEDGAMPGLDVEALFVDGVHLSPLGNYFLALVHHVALFRRSPLGATNQPRGEGAEVLVHPSEELARRLQALALRAVIDDPYSGVRRIAH